MKKIKYLFFFILFLSFSKVVHADGLNCNFALFNVYNRLLDNYDVWYLNEDTQNRDIGSPTYESVGFATRSKIGNTCISSYEMNSQFVSNQFYGYVIGFYDNGNGSRIFLPAGQEQAITLYLDTRAYNLYNSYGLRLEAYDTPDGSSRVIKTFNYADNCKAENHTIGSSSFTYKCDFKYSFPTDKYLTFYVRSSTAMTNYLALSIGYSLSNYYDNINDAINNMTDKITQEQDKTNQKLDDLNNSITNDNVDTSINKANDFFSGFTTDTFGLTSIITSPLNLIASITSSSCSPLPLQVPFLENTTFNLPCMSSIYQDYFGSFLTIYQTITFGITAYWVCIKIFALVKSFKDPESDKIEVLDL